MAKVKIPQDKDELLALAREVLKKLPKAQKSTGLRAPGKGVKLVRTGLSEATKHLGLARDFHRRGEAATKRANPGVRKVNQGMRMIAQVLKKIADDPKTLGEFGLTVDEPRSGGEPAGPTAP